MIQNEPEEASNSEIEPEVTAEGMETPQQASDDEKNKTEEYLANWQRARADFINYKRRTEQERIDLNRFANSTLILNLLPVLDDLERALDSIPPKLAKHDWADGIRLIAQKFRAMLEAQGLAPIKALGQPFNPNLHEAVRQDKGEDGIVIEEFQKGYLLHDRLLRPTKVVVGNGEEEEKEAI